MITLAGVQFRNPDIGDTIELKTVAEPKLDYAGGVHLIKKAMQREHTLTFAWLTRAEALDLRTLFITNKNNTITYIDLMGTELSVRINQEDLELNFDNRDNAVDTRLTLIEV